MTDYYKTALNLLIEMLKDSGYDNWINWLTEDIRLWETERTTEHHLRAYGGMGSFNDVVIGDNSTIGLWRGRIFGTIQTLAYSLAKGDIATAPLNQDFYGTPPSEISGWQCRSCGHAMINDHYIDMYVASYFIPQFFIKYLNQGNLAEILDIERMVYSEEVKQKHQEIKSFIKNTDIILPEINDWLWTCPKCSSAEVCAYRWNINENASKLTEADDNLNIKKLN